MRVDPYLLLAAAEGGGPAMIPALLDPHADPRALLADPPSGLPPSALARLRSPALVAVARSWLERSRASGHVVVTPADERYPERLRNAPLRPLALFALGDLARARECERSVAVVGSRTPTAYGGAAAVDFATTLARAGVSLWSGLAAGIDAAAHQACLDAGTPTVAVQAGGLTHVYPAHHAGLREQIVERGGLVLSELPPGRTPTRGHFPRRNRILALACEAVLVVEAGLASGSLHTARFAADAGTPVFAVPGPYTSTRSRGCHRLIEDGAQIASDPTELLRLLGVSHSHLASAADSARIEASADQSAILAVLEAGPRPGDLVQRESRLPADRYLSALVELLGNGFVVQRAGDLLARGPGPLTAGTPTRSAP